MRSASFTLVMLCAATIAVAQGQSSPSQKQDAPAGQEKTVTGCLSAYEDHFTLGTSSDELFLLEGDSANFKRYNAKMVQVTGTITEPPPGTSRNNVLSQQPPTLVVSKLKKVADGCN